MEKNNKDSITAIIIAVIIAFLYISGLPSALFIKIEILDIDWISITLFINIIFSMMLGLFLIKKFIPKFDVGFQTKNFITGLKKYGLSSILTLILFTIAFIIGLQPFDYTPSIWKVIFEGIIYIIGVGIIEEFFCRGLLQNALTKIFKNNHLKAILITSLLFGLGHIFGITNMPFILAASKVLWAVGLGIYFGAIYYLTNNLWLAAILHFIINLSGLPFNFSTSNVYPTHSAVIILITSILLSIYSIYLIRNKDASN